MKCGSCIVAVLFNTVFNAETDDFFAKKDRALADKFFDDLRSGAGLGVGDPVFILREKLITNTVGSKCLRDDAIIGCTIKAWNALRAGASVKRLTFRSGSEALPAIL